MRKLKRIVVVILAVLTVATTASAQFRWGIKGGINVNSLELSGVDEVKDQIFDTDNQTGYNIGLTTVFTVPVIGLGFDVSAMYVHRTLNGKSDYIDIPINLRYNLNLPVINKVIVPFATTGPSFAFLCSSKEFKDAYERKALDCAWNVNVGVLLFQHLQVSGGRGWGISKAYEKVNDGTSADVGRNNDWNVSVAILF